MTRFVRLIVRLGTRRVLLGSLNHVVDVNPAFEPQDTLRRISEVLVGTVESLGCVESPYSSEVGR